jgi:hypothetical protein
MTGIRPIIDAAVATVLAEHPKYFTELGHDNNRARTILVRKIWAALRGDGADKSSEPESSEARVPSSPQPMSVPAQSREARAFDNLRRLAGAVPQFRSADGSVFINAEAANDAVWALADLPPDDAWVFLTARRNVGAWMEFFSQTLPGVGRRPILQERAGEAGILMPWPWPPSKDGKVYTAEKAEEDAA